MRSLLPGILAALLVLPAASFGQSPPPAADPAPPATSTQPPANAQAPAPAMRERPARRERPNREGRAANPKRAECRDSGEAQGLRGADLGTHVQICVLEARVACLKQALAQKLRGRERNEFVRQCQSS